MKKQATKAPKASKKTPVIVTIKKGKHATQPFTYVIDDPGPGPKLKVDDRYAEERKAAKGALRKLKALTMGLETPVNQTTMSVWIYVWKTPDGRSIEFIRPKRKK